MKMIILFLTFFYSSNLSAINFDEIRDSIVGNEIKDPKDQLFKTTEFIIEMDTGTTHFLHLNSRKDKLENNVPLNPSTVFLTKEKKIGENKYSGYFSSSHKFRSPVIIEEFYGFSGKRLIVYEYNDFGVNITVIYSDLASDYWLHSDGYFVTENRINYGNGIALLSVFRGRAFPKIESKTKSE